MSKQQNLVVKDNKLIEASYRLTLTELRLVLAAIVLARENQTGLGDGFVSISATWFAETFNVDKKSVYAQLKEAVNTLFDRYFVVHDIEPETKKERVSKLRWISKSSYVDDAGLVQFCFAQDIVPFITRLEGSFTQYELGKIAGMSSLHAIRLYELLIQWRRQGSREREVDIAWLKECFMLEDEYSDIRNLKKRVFDVAIEQINKHSNLSCSYEQKKTGRQITRLAFNFEYKEGQNPDEVKKDRATKQAKPKAIPTGDPTGQEAAKRQIERTKKLIASYQEPPKKTVPPQAQPQPQSKPLAAGHVVCKKCGLHISEDLRQCPDCGHPKTPARVMMPENIKALLAETRKNMGSPAAAKPKAKLNPNPRTRDELIRELKSLGWVEPQPAV